MEGPQNTRITIWSSNPTPGRISRQYCNLRDTCNPMFIATLFTIVKRGKQPKCLSADEWMRMMWYTHTMECYSAIKKCELMPSAATWTQLKVITLSEIRQRQMPHDITYMWNLKYDTNEPIGGGGGETVDWEFGVGRCKLLYTGRINNNVLLDSTGYYVYVLG